MTDYYCDLHIHSCLSPCGDDEMTPANIAGMAALNGLQIVALTDHNSSKNCPAFFAQAKALGLIPIPGMELTTAEDVHIVCLFRTLEEAMEFDKIVGENRVLISNNPEIFGHQFIIDENDAIVGEEEHLLINATNLFIEDAYRIVSDLNGVCYPAHIDRTSNGIIAMLGDFPLEPTFTAFEFNDAASADEYFRLYPQITKLIHTVSSDAHYLWDIAEAEFKIQIDDEPYSSTLVRNRLIDYLSGKQSK